jgi:protein JSN1
MPPNNAAGPMQYNAPSPSVSQAVLGMNQGAAPYNTPPPSVNPQLYQAYMYQMYQQNPATMGAFHA